MTASTPLRRFAVLASARHAACTGRAPGASPALETERLVHGPFEIVAQRRRISTGA